MAWELMNEPRCNTDPSGQTIQVKLLYTAVALPFLIFPIWAKGLPSATAITKRQ